MPTHLFLARPLLARSGGGTMTPGVLLLENGRCFRGRAFGSLRTAVGEVVFNTSMTGYQEILTDPSYAGQLVVLTSSEIGNVGINDLDIEATCPSARALLIRSLSPVASSFRAENSLQAWMEARGIPGLTGIDTRALTRVLRARGTQRGILAVGDDVLDEEALRQRLLQSPRMEGLNLVEAVTCKAPYRWTEPTPRAWWENTPLAPPAPEPARLPIVAIDCGLKRSILRRLVDHGFEVTVVPSSCPASHILALEPAGIFVSNGPGDPAMVDDVIQTLRALLGKKPIFGICLGHQLLALALGARTFKLPYGHRGGNHPVKDVRTGKVAMTVHNHGFAVDPTTLPSGVHVTHINLNDGTCEGLELPGQAVFSLQYHPEAGPGPHDALEHFSRFRTLVQESGG